VEVAYDEALSSRHEPRPSPTNGESGPAWTLGLNDCFWPVSDTHRASPSGRCQLRIQPIDATVWWNRSAGVSKFNVFLGRSFNRLATALSFAWE
jgi:hypothetical protein